ncbi:MAG: hypothetical protein HKM04_07080 [Legionellales bacterium]|nr:hypothetical protein [Legionellales bacterium]
MKRHCMGYLFLTLLSLFLFSASARAAEPTLIFTSIPTVQDMGISASQTLIYTVKNTVPPTGTAQGSIPINSVILLPVSPNDGISWSTNCSNNIVPAGGSCNLTVVLTAKGAGAINQTLNIYYGNRNTDLKTPITFGIGQGLIFTAQPTSAQNMLARTTQVLTYTVQNQSTSATATLGQLSFTPGSASDTVIITNSCNKIVTPGGSCNIRVTIFATNTVGSVTQALSVPYTEGSVSPTLLSNSVTFTVSANSALLSFSRTPSSISDMNPNTTQNLLYIVQNTGGVAIPITTSVTASTGTGTDTATTQDFCSGSVPAQGQCTILVHITALTTGTIAQSLQVSYGVSNEITSPIAFSITNAVLPSISFVSPQPQPQDLNVNGTQTLTYQVQNITATAITVSGLSVSSSPLDSIGTLSIAPVTGLVCSTTCSNTTIPANCSCAVNVPITAGPTTLGTVNQTLSITSNATPSPLLSNPIIFAIVAPNNRNFTFENQCPFPVWIGIHGGGEGACGTGFTCSSTNETCVTSTSDPTGTCYFNDQMPPIDGNGYGLAAASGPAGSVGGVATISIPITNEGIDGGQQIIWSGIMTARTGCGGGVGTLCQTGDCSGNPPASGPSLDPAGACKPGTGFTPPAVQFEPTLANGLSQGTPGIGTVNYDSYDITMINGINVPIAGYPMNPGKNDSAAGFTCGAPGSPAGEPSAGIGGCLWNMTPPNNDVADYAMVAYDAAKACTPPSTCATPGDTCGLALNPVGNVLSHVCNPIIGYWDATTVCAFNADSPTAPAAYQCNQTVTPALNDPWNSYATTDLYSCKKITTGATDTAIPSCYNGGSPNGCCGCVNWNTLGIDVGTDATSCGVNVAQGWLNFALPQVQWFKEACPSAYVYQYDDATGAYVCGTLNTSDVGVNMENYIVQYCPNGETGGISN